MLGAQRAEVRIICFSTDLTCGRFSISRDFVCVQSRDHDARRKDHGEHPEHQKRKRPRRGLRLVQTAFGHSVTPPDRGAATSCGPPPKRPLRSRQFGFPCDKHDRPDRPPKSSIDDMIVTERLRSVLQVVAALLVLSCYRTPHGVHHLPVRQQRHTACKNREDARGLRRIVCGFYSDAFLNPKRRTII